MAILLSDNFVGSAGTIVGRTPDAGHSGLLWTGAAADAYLDGSGYIQPLNTSAADSSGACEYGVSGVDYGKQRDVDITFVMRTGANVGLAGNLSHRGVQVTCVTGGITISFRVWGYFVFAENSMTWYANINGGDAFVNVNSGILPNTEYTGVISIRDGVQTFTFLGNILTTDKVYSSALGLQKVALDVGGFSQISSILMEDLAPSLPEETAQVSLNAPSATLKTFGGANSSLTGTFPTLLSTGRSSAGENDFTYTAPSALLSAHGGANARLTAPSPTLTTTATFVGWGKTGISAPSATLSASGTVSGTGQAALTLSTPYKLVGYSGAVASITLTGKYTVQAQSTAGSIGGAAITCPLFELTAGGTARNYGSANLLAPAARLGAQAQAWLKPPGFTLTAIGSATITATYEAYAVNLLHPPAARGQAAPVDQTTRYTNFPFTHVVRYRNSYYGANATGLYLLEGTTDEGVDIPYTLRTAISDFKSPFRKTVASAYFGGRLGPDATMTLYAGEGAQTQAYSYTTPRGVVAQNYRQAFGKGVRQHRYYSLGISGTDAMALDSLELDTHNSTRRI